MTVGGAPGQFHASGRWYQVLYWTGPEYEVRDSWNYISLTTKTVLLSYSSLLDSGMIVCWIQLLQLYYLSEQSHLSFSQWPHHLFAAYTMARTSLWLMCRFEYLGASEFQLMYSQSPPQNTPAAILKQVSHKKILTSVYRVNHNVHMNLQGEHKSMTIFFSRQFKLN